jgi:hypothetical protein
MNLQDHCYVIAIKRLVLAGDHKELLKLKGEREREILQVTKTTNTTRTYTPAPWHHELKPNQDHDHQTIRIYPVIGSIRHIIW